MSKRPCLFAAAWLTGCAATNTAMPEPAPRGAAAPIEIAAFGDAPYAEDPARQHQPLLSPTWDTLIRRIEASQPAFAVHVGDLKQGGTECSDAYFGQMRKAFDAFRGSLFYTPGDNDWTDCHFVREALPSSRFADPRERLAALRRSFFSTQTSLGTQALPLGEQSKEFPENRMWRLGNVLYATLHVVGSNNNAAWPLGTERLGDMQEFHARDGANRAWIAQVNAEAQRTNSQALVWFTQADLQFERFTPTHQTEAQDTEGKPLQVEHVNGFYNVVQALYETSASADYPTLLVHGDYHVFRVRRPAPNLLAVEVPGEPHVDFARLKLELGSAQPFWAGLGSMFAQGAGELRLSVQLDPHGKSQIAPHCLESTPSGSGCAQVQAARAEIDTSAADCGVQALALALEEAKQSGAPLLVLSSSVEPSFAVPASGESCSALSMLHNELAQHALPVLWTHPAASNFVDQPLKALGDERLSLLSHFVRIGVGTEVAVRWDGKGVTFGL